MLRFAAHVPPLANLASFDISSADDARITAELPTNKNTNETHGCVNRDRVLVDIRFRHKQLLPNR